jgi:hypothetical protein
VGAEHCRLFLNYNWQRCADENWTSPLFFVKEWRFTPNSSKDIPDKMRTCRHLSIIFLLAAVRSAQLLRPVVNEIRSQTSITRKWDYSAVLVIRLRGGSASVAVQVTIYCSETNAADCIVILHANTRAPTQVPLSPVPSDSRAAQPQAAVALRPTARTVERDASEGLEAHKAALRRSAAASRPTLVVGALSNAGPSGAHPRALPATRNAHPAPLTSAASLPPSRALARPDIPASSAITPSHSLLCSAAGWGGDV